MILLDGKEVKLKVLEELKEKLKSENRSIASWITENAKKYLKENKK